VEGGVCRRESGGDCMKAWRVIVVAGACRAVRIGMGGAREASSHPYVELSVGVAPGSSVAFDGAKASLDSGLAGSLGVGFAISSVRLRLDTHHRSDTCVSDLIFGKPATLQHHDAERAIHHPHHPGSFRRVWSRRPRE